MKKTIWILAAIAMTVLSCSKQEGGITPPIDGKEEVTYLKINSVTAVEPTKAAIKDTKFPTEDEVSAGLFVVGDGYTDAKYSNIKYTKPAGSDVWTDPQIKLIEGKTATVYAYYPYDASVNSFEKLQAIDVASSINGNDWMWSTPVAEVSTAKPAIDLKFNHALALVEITFNVYGPEATMTNITLAGGEGAFSKAGSLDATAGTITPDTQLPASKTSPLSQDVELTPTEGKIIADCLLVPGKTGDDADSRQDFYIKCTYNGKTLSASLTGDNGVIISQNTKSTVSLNIRNDKLEVVSVGVDDWSDGNASGSTATIGDYTVTFNCPDDLKYDLYTESGPTVLPGVETQAEEPTTVIFRYEKKELADSRFFYLSEPSGCSFTHDALSGVITVSDLTQDVTINVGYGTYIHYTATGKVTPKVKTAFGSEYDETRSTFSGGSGVIAIDGNVKNIGDYAFQSTNLTGIILPENLETIGESAFDNCKYLVNIDFSKCGKLKTIGSQAFFGAGNYEECSPFGLVLPEGLEELGGSAFNSARISSVTLPSTLKTIGDNGFYRCSTLKTITSKAVNPPSCGKWVFYYLNGSNRLLMENIESIYVPAASVDDYKAADGWNELSGKISAIASQD